MNNNTQAIEMALGRLFLIASRPFEEGDLEMYEKIRSVVMTFAPNAEPAYVPNYARDRLIGAQGD